MPNISRAPAVSLLTFEICGSVVYAMRMILLLWRCEGHNTLRVIDINKK